MGRVQDKVCLITGGTAGIGYASAELFGQEDRSSPPARMPGKRDTCRVV